MSGKSMLSIALIFLGSIGFSSPKSDSCRTKAERGDESWTDACALRDSYDFIIIGGGTAGSILANRLSEVPQWSVLLLEAGKDETYESKIPFFPLLLEKTSMDWNYTTTRQKICKSE
uniref:Glucose dehydrogenase [acceptor] n=1 Tax=Lygus hesperus TaxID=30085 RepID=A0A0A9XMA3_LYGHE